MLVLMKDDGRMVPATATTAAYLMSEGIHIGLTDKEYRRAVKAMKKLDLHSPDEDYFTYGPELDVIWAEFQETCEQEYTSMLAAEAEDAIIDFRIMGFLEMEEADFYLDDEED